MPQEFQVLCCYQCTTFQVHQVKKTLKWNCKMCGEKQSIKKVHGRGSGADCRKHVQKLNMMRAQQQQQQQQQPPDDDDDDDEEDGTEMLSMAVHQPVLQQTSTENSQRQDEGTGKVGRWSHFIDDEQDEADAEAAEDEEEAACTTDRTQFDGARKTQRQRYANKRTGACSDKHPYSSHAKQGRYSSNTIRPQGAECSVPGRGQPCLNPGGIQVPDRLQIAASAPGMHIQKSEQNSRMTVDHPRGTLTAQRPASNATNNPPVTLRDEEIARSSSPGEDFFSSEHAGDWRARRLTGAGGTAVRVDQRALNSTVQERVQGCPPAQTQQGTHASKWAQFIDAADEDSDDDDEEEEELSSQGLENDTGSNIHNSQDSSNRRSLPPSQLTGTCIPNQRAPWPLQPWTSKMCEASVTQPISARDQGGEVNNQMKCPPLTSHPVFNIEIDEDLDDVLSGF